MKPVSGILSENKSGVNPAERQHRQILEMEDHIQKLIASSRHVRDDFFWNKLVPASAEKWKNDVIQYQDYFWNEVIGRIPEGQVP